MNHDYTCPDKQQIKNFASLATLKISPSSITIPNQDHTILNPLRYYIQRNNKSIELVGYTIPHPAEKCAVLKVQFKDGINGCVKDTVVEGLGFVEMVCERLLNALDEEVKKMNCNKETEINENT